MSRPTLSLATIALNRFGLGAGEGDAVRGDPRRYLLDQFDRFDVAPAGFAHLPDGGRLVTQYFADRRDMRQAMSSTRRSGNTSSKSPPSDDQVALRRDYMQEALALYRQAAQARMASAVATSAPMVERMVHFWSNHFCVSADNPQMQALVGEFERDAIRPHVLGRFEDMLLAVEQHPAMLLYLNQAQSVGPNSPAAEKAAKRNPNRNRGLNENLAREIMELHTLGVRSGYTQADVTEFARALTGWTASGVDGDMSGDPMVFRFRPSQHEPGQRKILDRTYDQSGTSQGGAALADFSAAPQTAVHIATKLARHFAGDIPPQPLVDRLTTTFTHSKGDLPTLYHALIESPEAWVPEAVKFRTPWEWTVASLRLLGPDALAQNQAVNILKQLGQPMWKPGSPAGWDDLAASWAGPDALLRRVEFAQRLAARSGDRIDARTAGPQLLPGSLSAATADQVARAESPVTALALLLVSPDMLRR
ncbi:DUF1800 domain-containing protein [Novosphingobium sp. 1949]|uniref:DUF1800 domain-containing protein n=1 Tax=Novosphingobium organovorum TaxID=2930092 RepID=A0ABT0BGQ8_9SPHN|nr:DUF1800 domain-containing protein [Novosphingobium organovorum]MCJ2184095.1 DUF1800 domain-containing protein [Novosphingobium organovorum]